MSMSMQPLEFRARRPIIFQEDSDRSAIRPEGYVPEEETVPAPEEAQVIDMKEKLAPPRERSTVECVFWLAVCAFILYYGDSKRHFFLAVLKDPRVIKKPFFIGCLCLAINTVVFLHLSIFVRVIMKDTRHFDHAAPGAVSALTMFGIMAYGLFAYSLWPIWGPVILPILWSFFMGLVVVTTLVPPHSKSFKEKYYKNKD